MTKHPELTALRYFVVLLITAYILCFSLPVQTQSSVGVNITLVATIGTDPRFGGGCGSFSPDGSLISVTETGVFEVNTGNLRFAILGQLSPFSPDGQRLVAGVNVHDTTTGQILWRISVGFPSYVFSDDGSLLAVADAGVYSVNNGEKVYDLPLVNPLMFDSTGTLLLDWGAYDSPITLYDLATGQARQSFGNNERLVNSTFSPDGSLLFVGGLGFFDTTTGNRLFRATGHTATFSASGRYVFVGDDGLYSVPDLIQQFSSQGSYGSFNPDETFLFARDEGIIDFSTGEIIIPSSGFSADFTPTNQYIALGGDGVYDLNSHEKVFELTSLAVFDPSGSLLAVENDGIYAVDTWERIISISGSAFFNASGSAFAVETNESCSIYVISR